MLPIAFPIIVSIATTVLLRYWQSLGQLLRTEGGSTTFTLGFDLGCRSNFVRPRASSLRKAPSFWNFEIQNFSTFL